MSCSKHKKYTGKRKPRSLCVDCWKLYCETRGVTIASVIEESNLPEETIIWLEKHINEFDKAEASVAPKAIVSIFGSAMAVPEIHTETKPVVAVRGEKV